MLDKWSVIQFQTVYNSPLAVLTVFLWRQLCVNFTESDKKWFHPSYTGYISDWSQTSCCHYFQTPSYHCIILCQLYQCLCLNPFSCRRADQWVLLPWATSWQVSSVDTIKSCESGLDDSFSQFLFDCRSTSLEPASVTCAASYLDSLSNFCEKHHNIKKEERKS